MSAARLRWVVPALALAAAGCGSSDRFDLRTPPPKESVTVGADGRAGTGGSSSSSSGAAKAEPITPTEERVIRHWASELRHGHVASAARDFALPVVVANGSDPVTLRTRAQAEAFNRALPCGAVVVRLDRTVRHFVVTTFRLVERPGPGRCGTGVGHLARTAFLIRHGHIAQWLRVADPPDDNAS